MRCAYAATPPDRPLLCAGRESKCPLLRQEASERDTLDQEALDLRPRTNQHFTLKTDPLKREDLDEFVACYNPSNRHNRKPSWSDKKPDGRWRAYEYDELIARDKASLDIFWLKDDSLEDSANLPNPDIIAQEIVDDLEAALEQFRLITNDLGKET